MAKFCKMCGSALDLNTGKCPNCDKPATTDVTAAPIYAPTNLSQPQPQPSKKELKAEKKRLKKQAKQDKKKQKKAQLTKKQKVKRFFIKLIAILLALIIAVSGCLCALVYFDLVDVPFLSEIVDSAKMKILRQKEAEAIEKAFKDGDAEKVNMLIFGDNSIKVDDNTSINFGPNNKINNNGIISYILKRTEVDMVEMDDSTITYKIASPNMKGVFDNVTDIETQEELLQHIFLFVDDSKTVERNVTVNYVVTDSGIAIDYQTTEFLDAILGGLVSEYSILYEKALAEINK